MCKEDLRQVQPERFDPVRDIKCEQDEEIDELIDDSTLDQVPESSGPTLDHKVITPEFEERFFVEFQRPKEHEFIILPARVSPRTLYDPIRERGNIPGFDLLNYDRWMKLHFDLPPGFYYRQRDSRLDEWFTKDGRQKCI